MAVLHKAQAQKKLLAIADRRKAKVLLRDLFIKNSFVGCGNSTLPGCLRSFYLSARLIHGEQNTSFFIKWEYFPKYIYFRGFGA